MRLALTLALSIVVFAYLARCAVLAVRESFKRI